MKKIIVSSLKLHSVLRTYFNNEWKNHFDNEEVNISYNGNTINVCGEEILVDTKGDYFFSNNWVITTTAGQLKRLKNVLSHLQEQPVVILFKGKCDWIEVSGITI